jgi:carboxyl-terminal processing protease
MSRINFIMEKLDKKTGQIDCKNRNSKILIGAIILFSFTFGWALGHLDTRTSSIGYAPSVINKDTNQPVDFGIFWRAWDKIIEQYDGKVDMQKMVYGAISGMITAVGDPYTVFMTPEQSKAFDQELEGTISGIGAEVGIRDNKVIIVSPIENSPAQKVGLKAKDIILKIDDLETTGMDLGTAVSKIRGEIGTKVVLTIKRGDQELKFEITREKIETKSVKYEMKEESIAYIEINRFDSNTTNLLKEALSAIKYKDSKGVILDLRNNPGGYLDSAVSVSSEFIQSGTIVEEKRIKDNKLIENFKASGKGQLTDAKIPLVILVNGGSASASEIVAGAVQDNKRGILIGEKTFGKGSVQTIENVGDGSTLRITIAHWFTPNGKNLSQDGISPDIEVKLSDEEINKDLDPQLDKALEYIKSKI